MTSDAPTPQPVPEGPFVASRFVSLSFDDDGALVVHSSRTGAIGVVAADQAETARRALLPTAVSHPPFTGVLADLVAGGMLIPQGMDEAQLVRDEYLERYDPTGLHLVILPTEECNFRCVYCYESFLRGEMPDSVQAGIRRFVAANTELQWLNVQWFGGEPLLAPGIMIEMSRWFQQHAERHGIEYVATATTNGALLTPEVADQIIPLGVGTFQITLDGVEHDHDARRQGRHGEKTFQAIMDNLRYLRSSDLDFKVILRHNFDPETLTRVDAYLNLIGAEFGGDPRFSTHWHPIGRWGGANDATLQVCEGRSAAHAVLQTRRAAAAVGFRDESLVDELQPHGSVCYAANPRSFVIGPDGLVYKCTVELDYHDRNLVGKLRPDGVMEMDWHKLALWCETDGLEGEKKCTTCWFSPGCHGAVCPKGWLDAGDVGCPPSKQMIGETLRYVRAESLLGA